MAVILLVSAAHAEGFVVVCPINGMIDDGVGALVGRAVREATGATALIFEIDTPGGLVDSAIRVSQSILAAPCPTIAYVKGMGAISAGALISYACKNIIMTPDTNIGAATPVVMSPEGMMPTGEKEVSFMRAKMRSLAEANHHNPAIAEAMVDKDIELRLRADGDARNRAFAIYHGDETSAADCAAPVPPDTTIISPAGKLLTLTPKEAIAYGLMEATAANLQEVLSHFGYTDCEIRRIEPTWAEALFRFLTNPMVAVLLLMFGVGGILFEIKHPGLHIPVIIGVTCLALFFGSHFVIGLAEWIDVLLVLVGIALVLIEVFVIPGFGAVGVAGTVCILAGVYLALTGVAVPRYSWDYQRIQNAGVTLGVAAVTFTAFLYAFWRLLPHTPLYGWIVLQHTQKPEQGYVVQAAYEAERLVGGKGVATTMLRPAGRGRFGGVTYSVVSRGDYIPKDTPIVIVQVDGNRYVVQTWKENP